MGAERRAATRLSAAGAATLALLGASAPLLAAYGCKSLSRQDARSSGAGNDGSGDGGSSGAAGSGVGGTNAAGAAQGGSSLGGAQTGGSAGAGGASSCQELRARVNTLLGQAQRCELGSTCEELPNALCGCTLSVADADAQASRDLLATIRALEALDGCTWPTCPSGRATPDECGRPTRECRAVETDPQGHCQ